MAITKEETEDSLLKPKSVAKTLGVSILLKFSIFM
jgi:hypothetical protein